MTREQAIRYISFCVDDAIPAQRPTMSISHRYPVRCPAALARAGAALVRFPGRHLSGHPANASQWLP